MKILITLFVAGLAAGFLSTPHAAASSHLGACGAQEVDAGCRSERYRVDGATVYVCACPPGTVVTPPGPCAPGEGDCSV